MNGVLVVNRISFRFSQESEFGLVERPDRLNRKSDAGDNVVRSRGYKMLLLWSIGVDAVIGSGQLALRRGGLRVHLVRVAIGGDRMVCDFFILLQQLRIVLGSFDDFIFVCGIEVRVGDEGSRRVVLEELLLLIGTMAEGSP